MKAAESADIGKQVALRNVASGAYGAVTLTADWVRYTRTETGANSNFELASRGTFSVDNQVSALLWEGQLEEGAVATTNQSVTNRFDITEVGSPSLYYFDANGVNQSWRSASPVDFSGTDKVTVWSWWDLRQSTGQAIELSATSFSTQGTFGLAFQGATDAFWRSFGTTNRSVSRAVPLNERCSIVGAGDISAPLCRVIVNSLATDSTASQGTGNYISDHLNIFRRNNSSNPVGGRKYGVIIAGDNYDTRTIQRFSDYGLKPRRLITA